MGFLISSVIIYPMKILVFGAGAIGSVIGGFLAKAGEEVFLLGRTQHAEMIKVRGLQITGIWGEHKIDNIPTYSNSAELKEKYEDYFDLIILTVKSYDTIAAMADIRNIAGISTYILSLQNGLGNLEAIAKVAGEEQVLGGRVIFGAQITSPGVVKVTVSADDILIGRYSQKTPHEDVEKIANAFNIAGLKTRVAEDVQKAIWGKVVYNCALNPLASLLNVTYGELLETVYTKDIIRRIVAEVYAVAEMKGIAIDPPTKDEYLKLLFNKLVPLTSSHHPSMLQDIEKRIIWDGLLLTRPMG